MSQNGTLVLMEGVELRASDVLRQAGVRSTLPRLSEAVIPTTAGAWQLYSKPGAAAAGKALGAALALAEKDIEKGLAAVKDRHDQAAVERVLSAAYVKHLEPALRRYGSLGATDTASREIGLGYLNGVANRLGFPGDFYIG